MKQINLKKGDCIELMKKIPDGSVDLVLTDPPYGTTDCKWDSVIPFEPMWEQLNRIIKPNGAICLFGSEPFSSALRMSNIKHFKYDWIWEKTRTVGFLNAKNAPLKRHEIVSVFSLGTTANCSKNRMEYNPQGLIEVNQKRNSVSQSRDTVVGSRPSRSKDYIAKYTGYPDTVLRFSNEAKQEHPTQKPVPLLEYLIRTYTNEGETVLDFTAGSMSTVIACINTNRNCIAIEKDEHYFSVGCKRVRDHILENNIDLCYNQVCGGVCLWQSSKTEQVKDMVGF